MKNLSPALLAAVFVVAAGVVWWAGKYVSDTTDVLTKRLKIGQALGGLVGLAVVTNLPEIAITTSAALHHQVGLAVGNLLGGIAAQTVVLALLDGLGTTRQGGPLTHRVQTLVPALEAALVVAVLAVVLAGSQLPASLVVGRVTPAEVLIAGLWLLGLYLINKAQRGLPWRAHAPASATGRPATPKQQKDKPLAGASTTRVALTLGVAALATLGAGVALELSGEQLASQWGMTGALFGGTILAAATALPELSTGLAALRLDAYELAVGDIFGGNAFLPVLFLLASLVSGQAVLPRAHKADLYLTALGMLLTSAYLAGLVFRSRRRVAGLGLDSLAVLVLYALGVAGLFFVGSQ